MLATFSDFFKSNGMPSVFGLMTRLVIASTVLASNLFGQSISKDRMDAFVEFSRQERHLRIVEAYALLQAEQRNLKAAEKRRVSRRGEAYRTRDQKKRALELIQKRVERFAERLAELADPEAPYFAFMQSSDLGSVGRLSWRSWPKSARSNRTRISSGGPALERGSVAEYRARFYYPSVPKPEVDQVINGRELFASRGSSIVMFRFLRDHRATSGTPLKCDESFVFHAKETVTYDTLIGATNTVLLLEQVLISDRDRVRFTRVHEYREWRTADDEFSISAVIMPPERMHHVTLYKRSGTTVHVKMSRLSREDQDYAAAYFAGADSTDAG